ncbi:MAG: HEAT repeat domain-containing protein, partial [Candidatus Eremiobacteraeota bacterium]|nr:HEAT repeat domain-containing protein [Candidatus Eremiobacteraeota bacterium]
VWAIADRRASKTAASRALISEFKKMPDDDPELHQYKGRIGGTLDVIADDDIVDDLIDIVKTPKYKKSRAFLLLVLGRMRDPRAVDTLILLLGDEDPLVAGRAVAVLRGARIARALPAIEPLIAHHDPRVREEARKALKARRIRA